MHVEVPKEVSRSANSTFLMKDYIKHARTTEHRSTSKSREGKNSNPTKYDTLTLRWAAPLESWIADRVAKVVLVAALVEAILLGDLHVPFVHPESASEMSGARITPCKRQEFSNVDRERRTKDPVWPPLDRGRGWPNNFWESSDFHGLEGNRSQLAVPGGHEFVDSKLTCAAMGRGR